MIPFILIDFFLSFEGFDLKHVVRISFLNTCYSTLFYMINRERIIVFVENDAIGNGELQSESIV